MTKKIAKKQEEEKNENKIEILRKECSKKENSLTKKFSSQMNSILRIEKELVNIDENSLFQNSTILKILKSIHRKLEKLEEEITSNYSCELEDNYIEYLNEYQIEVTSEIDKKRI